MEHGLIDAIATIRNLSYLVYGFAIVWTIVMIYLFILSRRQENLRDEIDALKKTMEMKSPED